MGNFDKINKGTKIVINMVTKNDEIQLTCNIPEGLWKKLGHESVERKTTKRLLIIEALEQYLKK